MTIDRSPTMDGYEWSPTTPFVPGRAGHRGAAIAGASVAGSVIMTGLREALAGYLDLRRGLGFKLAQDKRVLSQFTS